MKRIGITGGIGTGKSYVCRQMAEKGIPVYDCDREAKRLEEEYPELRRGITALVGPEAYGADGRLNRSAVAAWLFSDEEHLKAMNALVHPAVKRVFGIVLFFRPAGIKMELGKAKGSHLYVCGFVAELRHDIG